MTKDDVIRMAETQLHRWWLSDEKLERFANLVAAHEREECAKVCDDKYKEFPEEENDYAYADAAKGLAASIRARGTT
mgnify:CR=1 FL=1